MVTDSLVIDWISTDLTHCEMLDDLMTCCNFDSEMVLVSSRVLDSSEPAFEYSQNSKAKKRVLLSSS
jgi:hypothetical protein